MMFESRSFGSSVLTDTLPADQARPIGRNHPQHEQLSKLFGERFQVLLPVLDLFNHMPGTRVEWKMASTSVGLQVKDEIEGGSEICNNYGPRDNETCKSAFRLDTRD